jgi:hypothetical protein
MQEEGSSATSNVRDVTDVTDVTEGRKQGGRRKEEAIKSYISEIKNFLIVVFAVAISLK